MKNTLLADKTAAVEAKRFHWLLLVLAVLLFIPTAGHARRNSRPTEKTATKAGAEPVLRVRMGSTFAARVTVKFPEGGQITNDRGRRVKSARKGETFSWELPAAGKKRRKISHKGETLLFQGGRAILELNGKPYRGQLQISFSDKGARVINLVGIEDYLRGVVGSEIGSRSPAESLKAQTVIARTYAYASRGKHKSEGADVCDSTHCQVYSGVSAERDTIDPAVAGTRGIIMISDGEPITTLYHATCGGMTSDNDKVYGGAPRSYLRRVVCPFCKEGSNYRWSRSISLSELKAALRSENIVIDRVTSVEVDSPAYMDRATALVIHGNRGTQRVKGTTIRRLFNLPSTTFVVGNRRQTRNLLATAPRQAALEAAPIAAAAGSAISSLTEADGAPQQMLIETSRGLKRSQRPADGWKVLAFRVARQRQEAVPMVAASRSETIEKIDLFGRGYGHQVGLCQSGTIALGKRNWTYRQILALYYSNVALRSLDY